MKNRILYFFIFFLCVIFGFSQKENNKWYFGLYAGLDFNTSPPSLIATSSMSVYEGSASVADAAGNLLFYTDGMTIWDKTNTPMANGTGLAGSQTPCQSAVIVKKPGSNSLYYVFTVTGMAGITGVSYSIVDMSLMGGNGAVTSLNVSLLQAPCQEKLAATRHCNGVDYWIVTYNLQTASFCSFLLTSTGINPVPAISGVPPFSAGSFIGTLKISPNGKKLISMTWGSNFSGSCMQALYDFDISTGLVSNMLCFPFSFSFGTAFSPDASKLYIFVNGAATTTIFQYDLCAGSSTAILASQYSFPVSGQFWHTQLGPDGKIYAAGINSTALGVINNPNLSGAACNFVSQGVSIAPFLSYQGLPNNVVVDPKPVALPFTYTLSNGLNCYMAQFTTAIPSTSYIACSASGYSLTGFVWNFGDPSSGAANTSTLANPTHIFSGMGSYSVNLVFYYSCGGGTDTLKQVININQPCISVNSNSITCASLGSATVTALAGIGPFSYTWMPGNQTNSVASNLSPGSYTVTVFDAGSNSSFTASIIFNPLVPLTGNINSSSSITCNGASTGTANVTNIAGGSNNSTNVNYLWTNGSLSYTVPAPTNLSAGLWNVIITDNLTACQINQFIFISQPPAMTLNLASGSPSACAGSSVVLTGTNSSGTPGYNYQWGVGNASNSQLAASSATVAQASAGTYIYTLTSTDANTCSISNTIAVDFIPNPIITVLNAFICPLAVGTLTASGATSYTWSNNSTGNTLSQSPLSNSQYSVVGSALGCTSSAVGNIVLKPLPFITFNANSPRCEGTSLTLNGFGGASYTWDGPNGFNAAVQNPIISPVSLNDAGVYNLTVTAANGCTASATKTILVHPTPTLSASGSTVCSVQTLSLFANSITGANYLWKGPLSYTSSQQNPLIANPVLNSSVIYTVKVTSPFNCINSATVLTSVLSPPVLNFSLSSGSLCAQALSGSPNSITLTSSGATTYTLITPSHIGNPNPGGPVSPLITLPPMNSGPTTATLQGSNGVCTVTTSVAFSIIPNPSVTVVSPTPVICAGKTYTYTNQGASSYSWNINSPGSTTYSTGSVAVTSPTINSVFSVVGGSLGCYSAIQTVSINVQPLPLLNFSNVSPTVCIGSNLTLNAQGTSSTYTWLPPTGLNTTNGSTVIANLLTQQTYTVTGSLNTCTNSAVLTVSVLPLPIPSINILKPKLCTGELVTLQGSGGESFQWQGPSGRMYAGQTVTFVAQNSFLSGNYTLMATGLNGCRGTTSAPLLVYDLPDGDLVSTNKNKCIPFVSDLSYLKLNSDSVTAQWEIDQKTFPSNFSYTFTTAGTYTVKGNFKGRQTSCTSTRNFLIEAYPLPIADFTFFPEKPVENLEEVIFTNTSRGEELKKWNWHFVNNEGYRSENRNTSYAFTDAGIYPVAMVVTNAWGCKDTIVKSLTVESDLAIYVPNVFTPNEDGLNDIFLPIIRSAKQYELSVFDRWGARIFTSSNLQNGWDGTYKAEPCKIDVYVWKIRLSSQNGEAKDMTGQVLLSR